MGWRHCLMIRASLPLKQVLWSGSWDGVLPTSLPPSSRSPAEPGTFSSLSPVSSLVCFLSPIQWIFTYSFRFIGVPGFIPVYQGLLPLGDAGKVGLGGGSVHVGCPLPRWSRFLLTLGLQVLSPFCHGVRVLGPGDGSGWTLSSRCWSPSTACSTQKLPRFSCVSPVRAWGHSWSSEMRRRPRWHLEGNAVQDRQRGSQLSDQAWLTEIIRYHYFKPLNLGEICYAVINNYNWPSNNVGARGTDSQT